VHSGSLGFRIFAPVKGLAPSDLLSRCPSLEESAHLTMYASGDAASRCAGRSFDALPELLSSESVERELTFFGLVGLHDPPRAEVRAAIEECHTAGIRVVMISGDHPATAAAIARHLGITSLHAWATPEQKILIRKFVRYVMTCHSAEIWALFLAPFLGLPVPLLPIQILWITVVTDGLPGLALAVEPEELIVCLALSTVGFLAVEVEKWLVRRGVLYREAPVVVRP
jgi:magnesium-transporting ATPase (P-type)